MTFEDYMVSLKELSDWLGDYRRVCLNTRSVATSISGIKKEANRGTKRADTLTKLDIIKSVNIHLTRLLGESRDYPAMYTGPSDTPENTLLKLTFTEPARLRQIVRNGYLPLFELHDEERARSEFRKPLKYAGAINNFHKATKVLVDKMDEVGTKTSNGDDILGLYIAIRDIGAVPPLASIYAQYRMNELFGGNGEETDRYCHRVNKFITALDKLEPVFRKFALDRNTLISEAEYLMETCIDRMEEFYADLAYTRILSVV